MIGVYEFGDPSETALENAVLAANGFDAGSMMPEAVAPRLDDTDPIDVENGLRTVRGFSLTSFREEIGLDEKTMDQLSALAHPV